MGWFGCAGVYKSSIDVALGKVISGIMDLETILRKIQKVWKPVRLWGEKPGVPLEVQLHKLQLGGGGKGKGQQLAEDADGKG